MSKEEVGEIQVWKWARPFVFVERWVSRPEDWLNLAGVSLIVVTMFITVADVVGRYFFNSPIFGIVDVIEVSMAGIVFLGLAYTFRVGAHIRVEFFVGMLKGRAYHLVNSFTLFLSLVILAVTFISSLQFTINSFATGDITPQLWLPVWPAKLCLSIGSFFICLRLMIQLIQHLSQVIVGTKRSSL